MRVTVGAVFCDERQRSPFAFTVRVGGQAATLRFWRADQARGARRCFIADLRSRGHRVAVRGQRRVLGL